MGEFHVGVSLKEILQPKPTTIGFLDFLATGANWQKAAQVAEISVGDFQFTPGKRALRFNLMPVQRQIDLHEQFALAERF